jgi:hypothetical protein
MDYRRKFTVIGMVVAAWAASAGQLLAIPILDPSAPNSLSLYSLGNVPGVDSEYSTTFSYEGLAINGNTLLLSVANGASATQTVWALPLVRNNGHIIGFGNPSAYAQVVAADQNSIGNVMAGGLVVTPQGLAYTTQGYSFLGQYKISNLSSALLDITSTGAFTGGLQNLPGGGTGQFKVSSVLGDWYTLNTTGAFGAYGIGSYTQFNVGIAAYSFDYIPVDDTFTRPSVVLGDAGTQRLDAYAVDANGNPCNPAVNASCAPVIHLVTNNVAIGYGVVRDPVSGDILFTTQDNDIWLLSDSVPEPGTILTGLGGLVLVVCWRRKSGASPVGGKGQTKV